MLAAATFVLIFQYTLPPGWIDLANPSTDVHAMPMNAVSEARSGKYKVYAIDPDNVTFQGANALFDVIETPERRSVSLEILERSVKEASALARARGYTWKTLRLQIAQLDGVDVGVVDATLGNEAGKLRLREYFIPGKTQSAVLTYGCKLDDFARYRPIFEASAMATRGAYAGAFDWPRAMKGAFVGALIGLLVTVLAIAAVRRRGI